MNRGAGVKNRIVDCLCGTKRSYHRKRKKKETIGQSEHKNLVYTEFKFAQAGIMQLPFKDLFRNTP